MNIRYEGPVAPTEEIKLADKFEISATKPDISVQTPAVPKERKLIAPAQEQGMMHYSVRGITKIL